MHDQSSSPEQVDSAILALLTAEAHLWAVVEVEREIGDPVVARDSLRRLRGAGLVHEIVLGGFVMATRAAREAEELS